jgi:hypothetical protein
MASGRMTSEAALMSWVAVGTVKQQMEALPLPAGQTRQVGETNLDDRAELREGCLRDRFELGQMMAFWSRRRPCRARPVLCLWKEY